MSPFTISQISSKSGGDRYLGASTALCDVVRVTDINLIVTFSDGAQWSATQETAQPVSVSLSIPHDIRQSGSTDDLSHSIDYSAVLSSVTRACSSAAPSLEGLADRIFESCFALHPDIKRLSVSITRPRSLLHAAATSLESHRTKVPGGALHERFGIWNLQCHAIVGLNACEREEKQRVKFDISLDRSRRHNDHFDFRGLARVVLQSVQDSSYHTLEALATSVARSALLHSGHESDFVTIRAAKPSALPLADAAEVEIIRTLQDFPELHPKPDPSILPTQREQPRLPDCQTSVPATEAMASPTLFSMLASVSNQSKPYAHRAAIAVGANLGDRFANIELALRLLEAPVDGSQRASVVDTSFMYETAPMYVTDQPKFINCACMVETHLAPLELLQFVKDIENSVGRVASFRNGPRAIDLDILTYDSIIMDSRPETDRTTLYNLTGHLVVPHPRIAEREFVLRPLNDIIPDFVHPISGKPVRALLRDLLATQLPDQNPMYKVMPFPRYPLAPSSGVRPSSPSLSEVPVVPPTAAYWQFPISSADTRGPQRTYIMGTLNATPDSFSDGSAHNTIPAALEYATSSVAAGADIIDIGGYSTRPRAEPVSVEDELSRVVPVVEAIRNIGRNDDRMSETRASGGSLNFKTSNILISVDTFRADVASAAVRAGANCINDVYAFTGPEYPLTSTSAEHFLHMRSVARELVVPVVLMHSRGEASANKDYTDYSYAADRNGRGAVLEGVRAELGDKIDATVKGPGGLRRWLVLVDPGIGFSKTVEGNLELLRNAAALTAEDTADHQPRRNPLVGFPQLIGASRKSFLGAIMARSDSDGTYVGRETKPIERGWATAAAVSCAVQQKADIIRVHDVLEMGDVIRISSALWRN